MTTHQGFPDRLLKNSLCAVPGRTAIVQTGFYLFEQ